MNIEQTTNDNAMLGGLYKKPEKTKGHREDFMEFFGAWSDSDLREFNRIESELNQVDPADWQ